MSNIDRASDRKPVRLTRRSLLALGATLAVPCVGWSATSRLAVIDWGILETVLALGAAPIAATELIQFRSLVVEPAVPASVSDLGLRGSPNYELLRTLAPDLIVISGFYEYQRPLLERIAPVLSLQVYEAGQKPYGLAETSMVALGGRIGRSGEAARFVEDVATELARHRAVLASKAPRSAFIISLGDSRHFRAFGLDSMFGDVLERLGFANAWTDTTSYSAAAPVGIEALARNPDASIIIIAPVPPQVRRGLADNALWNALPAVRQGRVSVLEPVNHFGGLPSARRFARLLAEAMQRDAFHG